jgi:hypothetical protein
MRRLGFPYTEFPQCPNWAKWSSEIYWWNKQLETTTAPTADSQKKTIFRPYRSWQTSQCCTGMYSMLVLERTYKPGITWGTRLIPANNQPWAQYHQPNIQVCTYLIYQPKISLGPNINLIPKFAPISYQPKISLEPNIRPILRSGQYESIVLILIQYQYQAGMRVLNAMTWLVVPYYLGHFNTCPLNN